MGIIVRPLSWASRSRRTSASSSRTRCSRLLSAEEADWARTGMVTANSKTREATRYAGFVRAGAYIGDDPELAAPVQGGGAQDSGTGLPRTGRQTSAYISRSAVRSANFIGF